jgi:hypothetical protein
MDDPATIAIVAGLIFTTLGFGLGYAFRAMISARHRSYARQHRFSNQPANRVAAAGVTDESPSLQTDLPSCDSHRDDRQAVNAGLRLGDK